MKTKKYLMLIPIVVCAAPLLAAERSGTSPLEHLQRRLFGASTLQGVKSVYPQVMLEVIKNGENEPFPCGCRDSIRRFCINRHFGCVNASFLDSSVRKVGLKELWTLKWHRGFNTANEWTLAGGVQSTDWPEWMRKFKDY